MFSCIRFFLCFSILSVFSYQSLAIDHRVEIGKAQKWADSFKRDYPIFIVNRDEVNFLFLKNNALGETKEAEKQRVEIVSDYIKKKTGVELDSSEHSHIASSVYVNPDSAMAIPFFKAKSEYKLCTVFVNSPNGNDRIEVERLTGLLAKEAYSGQTYDQLAIKENFDVMYLFSLYHEVSHCLDQEFLPNMQGYIPSSTETHRAESFAETLAYLKLIERLGADIAHSRLLYRTIYARKLGQYFKENPQFSFGNELVLSTGSIYFLTPVLREAYLRVSMKEIKVEELTDEELYKKSVEIVHRASLDGRSMAAIGYFLGEGEEALEKYEEWSFNDPQYFLLAYERLVTYVALTSNWLERGFVEAEEFIDSEESTPEVPETLCQELGNQEPEAFLDALDLYREELNRGQYSTKSRYQRYQELNHLGRTLSELCL